MLTKHFENTIVLQRHSTDATVDSTEAHAHPLLVLVPMRAFWLCPALLAFSVVVILIFMR